MAAAMRFVSLALLSCVGLVSADGCSGSQADVDACSAAGVEEDASLLQLNGRNGTLSKGDSSNEVQEADAYKPRDIRGKSLYFIVADYFADPPPGQQFATCSGPGWCNGTIKGITSHLDYIQGMGFEGIWVTPLIKQFYGPDPDGRSGYGNYGYWAADWFEIDPNFGTEADVKELSAELHKRDMVFVYDIVLNHVGPVHSEAMLANYSPFNKPEYLHQLGIDNMTFDEYAQGYAYGGKGYPNPVQGLGPGAMCNAGPDGGCSNYHCPVDPGFGHPCPVELTYWGDMDPPQQAPGPKDIPNCGVGDLVCAGYNAEQTIEGWFYDLGDLNHTHPFVSAELIKWGKYMRDTYHIDGFRLDTAPYVSKSFLSDFQAAVGIPILGEVTASNWTFFKSYAPKDATSPVLKGLLNFYLQNVATPGFCGPPAFFPGADLNLTRLGAEMTVEREDGAINDLDLLGNFVDNHDMARLALYCDNVMPRMKNALAWTMLSQGIPIIYYGTEHFFNETHPPMWNAGYSMETLGYLYLKGLNAVRKQYDLNLLEMKVEAADANHLIFSRGSADKVFVFLNNLNSTGPVDYVVDGILPALPEGEVWVDALHNNRVVHIVGGKFMSPSSEPALLALGDATPQVYRSVE